MVRFCQNSEPILKRYISNLPNFDIELTMSLQELTTALRKKEDDKSEVIKTLQLMGQISNDGGAVGRILFQVTECFIDDMKFDIAVLPTDSVVRADTTELNNKVRHLISLPEA